MSSDIEDITQKRLREIEQRWGDDQTNWFPTSPGVPYSLSRKTVAALHAICLRTITVHDRDAVVLRVTGVAARRAVRAQHHTPEYERAIGAGVQSEDIDYVNRTLDAAFRAMYELQQAWGLDPASWLPAGRAPAPSSIDWDPGFLRRLARFATAHHPDARKAMVDRFFPEAIRARRLLNARSSDKVAPSDMDVAELMFSEALEKGGFSLEDYASDEEEKEATKEMQENEDVEEDEAVEDEDEAEQQNEEMEGEIQDDAEEIQEEDQVRESLEALASGHKHQLSESSSPASPEPRPQKRQETATGENRMLREKVKDLENGLADIRKEVEELKALVSKAGY